MKWMLAAATLAVAGIAAGADEGKERAFKFSKDDLGNVPTGWKAEKTGKGEGSVWKVVGESLAKDTSREISFDLTAPVT